MLQPFQILELWKNYFSKQGILKCQAVFIVTEEFHEDVQCDFSVLLDWHRYFFL